MKIFCYIQPVLGLGPLYRTLEILKEFPNDQIQLVTGGKSFSCQLPPNIKHTQLPELYMTHELGELISPDSYSSLEQVWLKRKTILSNHLCFDNFDLILLEMFPFGRHYFRFEILDILQKNKMKRNPAKVVCSLRDILVEKENGLLFEQRAVDYCNRYVDLILHHSDASLIPLGDTFSRTKELRVPIVSTGYITRNEQKVSSPNVIPTITLSVGNGQYKEGLDLIRSTMETSVHLRDVIEHKLNIYTGPFSQQEFKSPSDHIRIEKFTDVFISELASSHLSVSLGGSTLMDLLSTGTPGIVYPYQNNREQQMRTERVNTNGQFKILSSEDLNVNTLFAVTLPYLKEYRKYESSVDLNGASNSKQHILNIFK